MKAEATPLSGVTLIKPTVHGDARGFFLETWRADRYAELGITLPFVQDNHSRSCQGTLRGLHLQTQKPQGKL
ncbi:MAG: dTDP-4-dehydrorhamnose 3,5-epimerase family protein, partial [Luminiphilus sp.]|nr:dTDP-4-dehydrorhamnose 3,5-epimerase family protein [Luminiphilus sp.]